MTDERYDELKRWVERHDREFEGRDKILLAHDDRLDDLERAKAVQDAAVAILRWIVALGIPFAIVLFELVIR